ncbi:MAG: molybdenum cofactor guanylyltransferase [Candidatus Sumerlaeota bacterium]|nr:molybdenum cofactor guanylyltransferase [Candidatus Sumerlaeota bacterium]
MVIGGGILAGGRSTRMGAPKEGVVLSDGRPMIEHAAAALAPLVQRLAVAGECRGYCPPAEWVRLADRVADCGPLAGIDALLASGLADAWLIVTCDQPLLTPGLLRPLVGDGRGAAYFVTESGESLAPFPCLLPASLGGAVSAALDAGRLSPRHLLHGLPARRITLTAADALRCGSINSPGELDALGHPPPNPR